MDGDGYGTTGSVRPRRATCKRRRPDCYGTRMRCVCRLPCDRLLRRWLLPPQLSSRTRGSRPATMEIGSSSNVPMSDQNRTRRTVRTRIAQRHRRVDRREQTDFENHQARTPELRKPGNRVAGLGGKQPTSWRITAPICRAPDCSQSMPRVGVSARICVCTSSRQPTVRIRERQMLASLMTSLYRA
jgi:hypothetical protein